MMIQARQIAKETESTDVLMGGRSKGIFSPTATKLSTIQKLFPLLNILLSEIESMI